MPPSISETDMLREGMWAGDLNDLMRAVISIDEFESKIDDQAIVIGFYIQDKDAAQDLNRFLQKSAIDLLDVDISPVPEQSGYYIVFVELMRNDKLPRTICDLVEEMSGLTNIHNWKGSVFGVDDPFKLDVDSLTKALATAAERNKAREKSRMRDRLEAGAQKVQTLRKKLADAMAMLKNSTVSDLKEADGHLVMHDGQAYQTYRVVAVGDDALQEAQLDTVAISFDPLSQRLCRRITIGLGDGWDAYHVGDCLVLEHREITGLLILQEI